MSKSIIVLFLLAICATGSAFDDRSPLMGNAVRNRIRYSPRYHIAYQDNGFSPGGENRSLMQQRLSSIASTVAVLKQRKFSKANIDYFEKYAIQTVTRSNDIGRQIDLAFEMASRRFQACGRFGGNPRSLKVTVEPSRFWACTDTTACQYLKGEFHYDPDYIRAANIVIGNFQTPARAFMVPLPQTLWWEFGNFIASQNGYRPSTEFGELGFRSPCGRPNARAIFQVLRTPEDRPLRVVLRAVNLNRDRLVYSIVSKPMHGTLVGRGQQYTYRPNPNFSGIDYVRYKIDAGLYSSISTIRIHVLEVPDPPVVANQGYILMEDSKVNIELGAEDVDSKRLGYYIAVKPRHGKISGVLPKLTYTPDRDYTGVDSFRFRVTDGRRFADGLVNLKILPVKD